MQELLAELVVIEINMQINFVSLTKCDLGAGL